MDRDTLTQTIYDRDELAELLYDTWYRGYFVTPWHQLTPDRKYRVYATIDALTEEMEWQATQRPARTVTVGHTSLKERLRAAVVTVKRVESA